MFTLNRFKLKSEDQVAEQMAAGPREVYIDTDKGDDVPDAPAAADVREAVNARMLEVASAAPAPLPVTVSEEIYHAHLLYQRVGTAVRDVMQNGRLGKAVQVETVAGLAGDMMQAMVRNGGALLAMLRCKNKDDHMFVHCVSVCTLMVTFGRAPGLPGEALRRAGVGGFVHDVANPLIPDPSLNKPGTQTDGEFLLVKRHSAKGRQILKCCSDVGEAPLDITLHHHERMDGKGYPEKLLAEKISKPARMVAFCRCLRCDHLGPAVSQRHRIHQGAAQNARMVQRPF